MAAKKNPAASPPPSRELLGFLEPYAPATRELALAVRAAVLAELPPCCEYVYDAYNAVAIGYGPNSRYQEGVCHVAVYARHVNLGYNFGAQLDDPAGVLEGAGRNVRHIKMRSPEDLARPEWRVLLRQAAAQSTLGPGTHAHSTEVKRISPRKRRPGAPPPG